MTHGKGHFQGRELACIFETYCVIPNTGISPYDLRRASLDRPRVLIFDGYDELIQASGKTYSNYINRIAEFQAEQRAIYYICVRCIITSRMALIDKASIPCNCHVLRLCEFDNTRIRIWCEIWNAANESCFHDHNIRSLEIAPSGRINELAGQPLLLLMLALYDLNENSLQNQEDISRAELYYRLINDFVKRERGKDSNYHHLVPEKQEKEIRAGFRNFDAMQPDVLKFNNRMLL